MAHLVTPREFYTSNIVLLQHKTICVNFNCQSDAIIVTLLHQQCNCAHKNLLRKHSVSEQFYRLTTLTLKFQVTNTKT